jgi:hypothetical protein
MCFKKKQTVEEERGTGEGGKVKSAEDFYQEMRVEPEPLPSLPTDEERVERDQMRGMRGVSALLKARIGQKQRTLLNFYGGKNV